MRRTLVATVLLSWCCVWADSQPPAPAKSISSQQGESKSAEGQQGAGSNQRGTQQSPIFIERIQSADEQKQAKEEATNKDAESIWERRAQIANIVIAAFTVVLACVTAGMWWVGRDTARRQLRAYLTVLVGNARYQDKQLRFEALPLIFNTGQTPAYKVKYWARADVFPFPLPDEVILGIPDNDPFMSEGTLGAQHNFTISGIVQHRVPEDEIEGIKAGHPSRVYVWGKVSYEDIFGKEWYTDFCQSIFWSVDGEGKAIIGCTYHKRHSRTT